MRPTSLASLASLACALRSTSLASLASLAVLAGCGPSVAVVRMAPAPARAPNCELEFRQFDMKDLGNDGPYEVLGHVALSESGVQDPLQEEYRAEVRPRACALGGEAVGVLMQATNTPGALSAGGTSIDYVVVRKRPTGKPAAPQRF